MTTIFKSFIAASVMGLCLPLFAHGPARPPDTGIPTAMLPSAVDYSTQVLPDQQGVVSWKSLAKVEPVKQGAVMVPRFSKEILDLDKQSVRIQGFILALDMGEQQKHFLISAVPPHCSFCLPAGPDAIVEVFAKKPVRYGMEPITVAGKLAVLRNDPSGVLYQLTEAEHVDTAVK